MSYPILEFDDTSEALIHPSRREIPNFPRHCVLSFYEKATERLFSDGKLARIDLTVAGETGELKLYQAMVGPVPVVIGYPPGAGGPLSAMVLEALIGFGVQKVIVCGHGGVLRKDILRDRIMVVSSAIRQEGLSYQYLKPSREVEANPGLVLKVVEELKKHGADPLVGKTWTIDSMYRETKKLIERRKEEGAMTVEMECASLLAVAQFRNIELCQLVCAGDDVSGDLWDPRYVADKLTIREKLILLCAEVCSTL